MRTHHGKWSIPVAMEALLGRQSRWHLARHRPVMHHVRTTQRGHAMHPRSVVIVHQPKSIQGYWRRTVSHLVPRGLQMLMIEGRKRRLTDHLMQVHPVGNLMRLILDRFQVAGPTRWARDGIDLARIHHRTALAIRRSGRRCWRRELRLAGWVLVPVVCARV